MKSEAGSALYRRTYFHTDKKTDPFDKLRANGMFWERLACRHRRLACCAFAACLPWACLPNSGLLPIYSGLPTSSAYPRGLRRPPAARPTRRAAGPLRDYPSFPSFRGVR